MASQEENVSNISNNIANVNTVGFKKIEQNLKTSPITPREKLARDQVVIQNMPSVFSMERVQKYPA